MIQTGGTTQLGLYEFKGKVDGAIEQFQVDGAAAIQGFQNSSNTEITQFETQANAALAKVESTGGLISVPTLTALQAITSAYANQSAIVEATGAYYRWNASGTPPAWVATGRNFLTEAAADAQAKADAAQAAAISTAATDASNKATAAQNNAVTAANTNTDNKFTAYMTGTQVLVKNYATADFSVIDSYVQTGVFSTNTAFNRTDYIAVKSGDVINLSAYLPAGVMGSFFSSDYTYITDINKTVNNGSNGYSTGTYTATQDGFIIANQNKGNATYASPTIVVTSKDRLVANSNLNTAGSALGYTKYISQLGGTDLLVDAYFANTNLTATTNAYSTFGAAVGDYNNKLNQGFRIYALGYTALVSLPIPVYAGTRIKGSVARSTNQQSLLILDANKKPLKFLDAASTANTSLQSVDIIIDVDGYLVIQHHSVTLQCNLRLFGKTRLLNSDLKDKSSGYLSYDYYVANVDKKTELDVTNNIKSVTNINRTKFTNIGVLADDTGYQASAYITCLPNLTFILENLFTRGGASLINFYDANYNFLAGVYGDSNILSYQRITSPENTAYVRFCRGIDTVYGSSYTNSNGTIITFDMAKFKLVMNASGVYYYTNYLLPMLTDQFLDVRGDSIGSGIAGSMINSGLIRTPTVRDFTVGGENVLDSMLRAGATSVEMKTKGLTIPANGTAVTVDAYFDFTRTVTYNADGTYTNSGGFRRANWGPNGTNIPFEYDGQKFFVDLSKDNVSTIRFQSAQAAAYSFTKDTAFSTKRGTNKGLLFLMMGTNGGFGITTDDAAFDNLLMMHKRITDTYQGKCMVAGYYFVPVAKKAYFRKIMESHYGERFVDFETHILTRGLSEMQITLNAEEKAFIAQYQGLTTGGGNSALPFFSGDNTHPGGVSYRCFTNELLRRAYLLGFIDKLYTLDLQIPTAAMITTVTQPAASIAVGATTTAQVGLNGSDAYLFEWTSSNPAVASVPTRKWTPPNANYGSWSSIVITGVSAGTATITCTCRYGGATKTFDITIT